MNDDLISRKALKAVISEYIDEYSDLDNEGYHCEKWCAMKEAEMAIDRAPTVCNDNYSMGYQDGVKKVLSERPQGEWIPVSEKLPNICGVYNVTKRVIDGGRRYYITDSCYFDGTRNWHNDNRINFGREYINSIIAWMPLPEPYKEAEHD